MTSPTKYSELPLDIEFTLPAAVKKILSVKDSYTVNSDMDYFYLLKAIVTAKKLVPTYTESLDVRIVNQTEKNLEFTRRFIQAATKISKELEELRENIMKKTDFVPTLERLMQDMEATPIERNIYEFLCLTQVKDNEQPNGFARNFGQFSSMTAVALSATLGCDVEDIMQFASTGSKWTKEKLISDNIVSPNDTMPKLTFGCEDIVMGLPLNDKQFLTIESDKIRKFAKKKTSNGFGVSGAQEVSASEAAGDDDALPTSPSLVRNSSLADSSVDISEFSDVHSLFNILKRDEVKVGAAGEGGAAAFPLTFGGMPMPAGGVDVGMVNIPNIMMGPNLQAPINPIPNQRGGGEAQEQAPITQKTEGEENTLEITPYKNDLAYIQEQIDLSNCLVSIANNMQTRETFTNDDDSDDDDPNAAMTMPYGLYGGMGPGGRRGQKKSMKSSNEAQLKKLRVKERVLRGKINERLNLTRERGGWYPRLERLVEVLKLSAFEKHVIVSLIRTVIAPDANHGGMHMMGGGGGRKMILSVGSLLSSFCSNLEEKITFRKYFYKDSRLVRDGILNMVGQDFMVDLSECAVEIDRRMLDFCLGLDTEISEVVDGSHLYTPEVDIEDIILPEDTKQLVIEAVGNFDRVKQVEKELEIDKKITYGRGMVLLFHGLSGTGKTMLANGVAAKMKRKILLINFPSLGGNSAGQIIKLIFREAKIHNAIVFFDECESLFMSRMKGSNNVNMLLTELERHDGLSILATNRASDLDEAMYRRITLSVEFRKPDHILREKIWKTLQPPKLRVDKDINLMELALKYELTGGFIKNAWLSALSFAVSRDSQNPTVTQQDLSKAASHQLRGRLSSVDFDRRIVPTRGLDMVILDKEVKSALQDMVNFGKSEAILFGQWGFSSQHGGSKGVSALFHGHPGTGKTMAAEAIGYDLGRPLKVVNCAQLLSKWVGESAKNIQAVFDEAKAVDAVLVFDEAESLFGSREGDSGDGAGRHDTGNVGILLHHIETNPGVVIVITNLKDRIDTAFFRRFKFVVEFPKPSTSERLDMWKLMIPPEAPLSKDVDLSVLANRFDFCGGNIKSVIFRAASRAALRPTPTERVILMEDLLRSCEEEMGKSTTSQNSLSNMSMFS